MKTIHPVPIGIEHDIGIPDGTDERLLPELQGHRDFPAENENQQSTAERRNGNGVDEIGLAHHGSVPTRPSGLVRAQWSLLQNGQDAEEDQEKKRRETGVRLPSTVDCSNCSPGHIRVGRQLRSGWSTRSGGCESVTNGGHSTQRQRDQWANTRKNRKKWTNDGKKRKKWAKGGNRRRQWTKRQEKMAKVDE